MYDDLTKDNQWRCKVCGEPTIDVPYTELDDVDLHTKCAEGEKK